MISAAARKRKIAASPLVSEPLRSSAKSGTPLAMIPAPSVAAAPVTPRPFRKERRRILREGWAFTSSVADGCEVSDVGSGEGSFSLLMILRSKFSGMMCPIEAGTSNQVKAEYLRERARMSRARQQFVKGSARRRREQAAITGSSRDAVKQSPGIRQA